MTIWLHRISHHAETAYPLIEQGYLSIGFLDFSTPEFVQETKEKGWSYFNSEFQSRWGSIPRTRYSLWRFIAEMKKGDLVVVPSAGKFSVYEIESDSALPISEVHTHDLKTWSNESLSLKNNALCKTEDNSKIIDLGFFRKVKLIESDIPKYDYADAALTARMKYRATNNNMSVLSENLNRSLEAYREKRPINLYSSIMNNYKDSMLSLICRELKPDKFESLIKWYFEKIGASMVYIPAKNESGKVGDADIVAVFEPIKTIFYVQAKFHKGETSDWATRQIIDYKSNKDCIDDGYSKIAWVVSTSDSFSKDCVNLATENNVGLFNGLEFTQMLLNAGFENLGESL